MRKKGARIVKKKRDWHEEKGRREVALHLNSSCKSVTGLRRGLVSDIVRYAGSFLVSLLHSLFPFFSLSGFLFHFDFPLKS